MNTRVTVPLSKEVYEAVSLLADIAGQSRGAFLAETIGAAAPSYLKIAAAYRKAQSLEGRQRQEYLEGMKMAEEALLSVLEQVHANYGSDLASPASTHAAASGAGAGEALTPDTLTGGSTPPTLGS